ncbi:hypothetical protein BMR1_02g03750 [Babesia microti strain RI]|uniref:Ribosome recycling factor domain-containing protein n=1 Tax=Babesia microti (strain RI) TaxID=1133968 RepID=A0A1R4AAX1_BABMR|nr:hypothetical protein BMR1_02g03750 [Babesia microti strain RI]SJK86135.1 hypothetical protein BMR1_02g03750 [Babesia microti strain RI]|eukprot:XP_021338329.1 hypothetical protein BMR1_02g03750 [Babesia microti strain RI]
MKKVGPERSDSLYTATLKISGKEHMLSELAQIVTKTPTLAHLHVFDQTQTLHILQAIQAVNSTWSGEISGSSKIILKIPKHQSGHKVKELIDNVRKIHQNGANRIDLVRKRGQNHIDKVRADPKWHKHNSAILKNAAEKATSSLTKLSKELVKNFIG